MQCGHGIYAVKDLKDSQNMNSFIQLPSNTNEIKANDFAELPSQIVKDFEDKYSGLYFHKNEDNMKGKDLEDKYSWPYFHKNEDNMKGKYSSQLSKIVKDLEDKYSILFYYKNEDNIKGKYSSQLSKIAKDLEDKYSHAYFHKNENNME